MSERAAKPEGRDEVRAAILAAANRQFARNGPNASLRAIADDANVNLGLIHRHFGNKDDLLRASLRSFTAGAPGIAANAPDLLSAVLAIADHSETLHEYLRVVAGLLIADVSLREVQGEFPGFDRLRAMAADDDEETRLLVSMLLIYGWAAFGKQLMEVFERDGRRDEIQAVVGEAIERLLGHRADG